MEDEAGGQAGPPEPQMTEEAGGPASEVPAADQPEAPAPSAGAAAGTATELDSAASDAQEQGPALVEGDGQAACECSSSGQVPQPPSTADTATDTAGAEGAAAAGTAPEAGQPPSISETVAAVLAAAAAAVPDLLLPAPSSCSSTHVAAAASSPGAQPASTQLGEAAGDGEDDLALLPPDHPLLRRAQEALHRQLVEQKLRLQEELRERRKALKARAGAVWRLRGSCHRLIKPFMPLPSLDPCAWCPIHAQSFSQRQSIPDIPALPPCTWFWLQDARQRREGIELYSL